MRSITKSARDNLLAKGETIAQRIRSRAMKDFETEFKEELDNALEPDRSMLEAISGSGRGSSSRVRPALDGLRAIPGWDRAWDDQSRSWPEWERETRSPEGDRETLEWMRAVANGDISMASRLSEGHARDLGTTVGSAGGLLVPAGFANTLHETLIQRGRLYRLCERFPVGDGEGGTLRIPKELTKQVVVFTAEGTAPSGDTEPTFGSTTLTARKVAAVVNVSHELLADTPASLSMVTILSRQCGEQMAYKLDDQILNATAAGGAAGTSFTGGVVEDATDVILNLKQVPFKLHGNESKTLRISKETAGEVTAADIEGDADMEVLDDSVHIATVSEGGSLKIEMRLKRGRGYVSADRNFDEDLSLGYIPIDSVHTPVKKVNYTVEAARLGQNTEFDKLTIEVWTDGSVKPEDSIGLAAKLIKDHMSIFINFEEDTDDFAYSKIERPPLPRNDQLDRSVDELELSVRSYNCLKNADIRTIRDLVQRSEREMLATKNFGKKSLNEIKEILNGMGLDFGMEFDEQGNPIPGTGGRDGADLSDFGDLDDEQ